MERISIVIPTYNHGRYIGEAIESALAQSRPADEILVVDNDSTDNTRDVVARYQQVRYIHQTNQGICGSSNRGLREAIGEYVVFLHSDDHLLPNHLETSLRAFQERPGAGLVSGDYRWFGAEGTWHTHTCDTSPDEYGALLRFNYIGPPIVVMFKREALLAVGGLRQEFAYTSDTETYLRMAQQYPIYCHHTVVAKYRRHDDQHSLKWDLLLKSAVGTMRSQQSFIKGKPRYQEPYRLGMRHYQRVFGEPLVWQMVASVRRHDWKSAYKSFAVLFQYYPQGLMGLIQQKASRAMPSHQS
jgi:glycosyltransferase involved in cell wall biosynthesis